MTRVHRRGGAAAARCRSRRRRRRSSPSSRRWRRDLLIEADIAEEVARVRGYETRPRHPARHADAALPALAARGPRPRPRDAGRHRPDRGRHVSRWSRHRWPSGSGRWRTRPSRARVRPAAAPIHVTNPLSSQHSVMRQSLVGSLLEVVSTNLRHGRDGRRDLRDRQGVRRRRTATSTHEWWRLGLALTGAAEVPAWDRPRSRRTTSTTPRA